MRHTNLVTLTTVLALAGCGGETPPPQAPPAAPPPTASAAPTPPPAETTPAAPAKPALADLINQSLKTFGEGMAARDTNKVGSLFSDDAVWTIYGLAEMHGRESIVKGTEGWLEMSKDMKSAPKRVWIKGNTVAAEIVFTGTMTNDFMGMKATNKPFGTTDFLVMTYNTDGLITAMHDYVDGPGFMAQLKGAKTAPALATLPAGPPEVHVGKGSPDEDKLTDWAKAFNDSFNATDPTKGPMSFAIPEADVTFFFLGGKTLASKELTKFAGESHKAIPDAKWTLDNAWGIDGYIVAEREQSGTFKGPLGPAKPTGKPVTMHLAEVIQPTGDGKLQHCWAYGDLSEIAPPPAPKKEPAPAVAKAGKEKDKEATTAKATTPAASPAAKAAPTPKTAPAAKP